MNEINKLCELYDLSDSWRSVNPNVFQFTWRDKAFKVQCRLYYFLISNELNSLVSDCRIVFTLNTDHSAVQLNIISKESKQSKGQVFGNSTIPSSKIIDTFRSYVKISYIFKVSIKMLKLKYKSEYQI